MEKCDHMQNKYIYVLYYWTRSARRAFVGRPLLRLRPRGIVLASAGTWRIFNRIAIPKICLQEDCLKNVGQEQ